MVWQFPAGKVDGGESAGEASARDPLEEAGVVVEPLSMIGEWGASGVRRNAPAGSVRAGTAGASSLPACRDGSECYGCGDEC
ncbi:NUDIX hydrolase [Streptomyces atriruber]|uniref:NUDIX hydrolase n=1 Tax=Streptomyces atriruber TaxID=545121 RepID=UPI000D14C1F5